MVPLSEELSGQPVELTTVLPVTEKVVLQVKDSLNGITFEELNVRVRASPEPRSLDSLTSVIEKLTILNRTTDRNDTEDDSASHKSKVNSKEGGTSSSNTSDTLLSNSTD
mmetsp:Transcript_31000/g.47401  ORF Transcript_31000/g.47401 Transcript_31000/m.47401 type:complete len:110 (+) Transcript_31000:246-575(+)